MDIYEKMFGDNFIKKIKSVFCYRFKNKYKKLLEIIVNQYENKHGKKNSRTNIQFINYIEEFIKMGVSWAKYISFKGFKSDFIKKKFYKWCRLDVFYRAFRIISNQYVKRKKITLFVIDSSDIQNRKGIINNGFIGKSIKLKSKNSTKLSILIDINKKVCFYSIQQHDVSALRDIITRNNIKNVKILGDKGYITNVNDNIVIGNNIKIITSLRKNMKERHTKEDKKLLKTHRSKVENVFCTLKCVYDRMSMIRDKNLNTFESFVSFSFGCMF